MKWNNSPLFCDKCGKQFQQLKGIQKLCEPIPEDHCLYCNFGHYRSRRVLCGSLCDWLDDQVPIEWLADLLKLIHDTPNLNWLMLTKRPKNFAPLLQILWRTHAYTAFGKWLADWEANQIAPENVWIGTTVEDQARADERIPQLLQIPAKVRFLSCEPLLGPIDLQSYEIEAEMRDTLPDAAIDWVIVGGESGPGARSCNIDWIRDIVRQCREANVPVFMKQWGSNPMTKIGQLRNLVKLIHPKGGDPSEWPEDLRVQEFPNGRLS